MSSGFFISSSEFRQMTERTREEILKYVVGEDERGTESDYAGVAADLSLEEAGRLIRGLSGKTRGVLMAILETEGVEKGFWVKPLAQLLEVEVASLTGVWSGLTRRTRTITGDGNVYLFDWVWNEEKQDYYGKLDTVTIKNLKKVLKIR